jgi:hypothetical protein
MPRRMPALPAVDCYRAGVEAWRHSHPNQTAAHAGTQAVAIILAARISLRVRRCVDTSGAFPRGNTGMYGCFNGLLILIIYKSPLKAGSFRFNFKRIAVNGAVS